MKQDFTKSMNRLLLIINGSPASIWQGFKEVCREYNLPYHTLKQIPFPRKWKKVENNGLFVYEIIKLPFRSKHFESVEDQIKRQSDKKSKISEIAGKFPEL